MVAANKLRGWCSLTKLTAITLLIATVSVNAAVEPVDIKAESAPGIDKAPTRVAKSLMRFLSACLQVIEELRSNFYIRGECASQYGYRLGFILAPVL